MNGAGRRLEQTPPPRHALLLTVLLALLCALIMFVLPIAQDQGRLTLFADFDEQEIAFNVHSIETLRQRTFGFDWSVDLGTPSVGAFSFYTLGSPFFYLAALFPPDAFFYVVGWLYVLKYVAAALTAFLFLRRHTETALAASFGALLYAFSGFNHLNLMYYHFHDVVAVFPLLLLACDLAAEKRMRGVFALAVAVSALTNYFFFFAEVLFLLLYFFAFQAGRLRREKRLAAAIGHLFAEGVLGVLAAAALLIPTFLFVMRNPRSGDLLAGKDLWRYDGLRYLSFLKALVFPVETFSAQSALYDWDFSSHTLYLPLVGPAFAFAAVRRPKGGGQARAAAFTLAAAAVVMLVPVLNSLLYFGIREYYARWFYMPLLIMALLSAKTFEAPDHGPARRFSLIALAAAASLALLFFLMPAGLIDGREERGLIFDVPLFTMTLLLACAGYAATYFLLRIRAARRRLTALLAALVIFSAATGVYSVELLRAERRSRFGRDGRTLEYSLRTDPRLLPAQAPNERLLHSGRGLNLGIMTGRMTQNSFISTISPRLFDFYTAVGIKRYVSTPLPEPLLPLASALSSRFVVQFSRHPRLDTSELAAIGSRTAGGDTIDWYENPHAVGLGFAHSFYLPQEEWERQKPRVRQALLLEALIVGRDDLAEVSKRLKPLPSERLDAAGWREAAASRRQTEAFDVERDERGCRLSFELKQPSVAWFSIPNEPGWTAFVDGEATPIIDSVAMIALALPAGTSRVELRYTMPGQKLGLIVSLAALVLTALLLASNMAGGRRQKHRAAQTNGASGQTETA